MDGPPDFGLIQLETYRVPSSFELVDVERDGIVEPPESSSPADSGMAEEFRQSEEYQYELDSRTTTLTQLPLEKLLKLLFDVHGQTGDRELDVRGPGGFAIRLKLRGADGHVEVGDRERMRQTDE
jgi:hypothetical protein